MRLALWALRQNTRRAIRIPRCGTSSMVSTVSTFCGKGVATTWAQSARAELHNVWGYTGCTCAMHVPATMQMTAHEASAQARRSSTH